MGRGENHSTAHRVGGTMLDTPKICRAVKIDGHASYVMYRSYDILDLRPGVHEKFGPVQVNAGDKVRLEADKKAYTISILALKGRGSLQEIEI